MGLSETQLSLTVKGLMTKTLDLSSVESRLNFARSMSLAAGTGANQADRMWHDKRTIAASGTDDIDLAGSLLDVFGDALTFARIKGIAVWADAGNTNNVVVGAAAATQFVGPFGAATHTAHARPGGLVAFAAPDATAWPVGAGASDLLRIANSGAGTPVIYDIVLIGASA
jgi:hypothetical protein